MRDLPCDVIRDLLPAYVDGLTSEASNDAVRSHLETCADCRAALDAMRAPEPERTKTEEKELDFLRKTNRSSRRRALWAGFGVLALALCALCVYVFAVGQKTLPDTLLCDVAVSDTALSVKAAPMGGAAVGNVKFSEADGVVTVSTRTVNRSPLHRGAAEETYTAASPIRQVVVNDRVVWDEGAAIAPFAAKLYATRHAYLGSAWENVQTANALFLGAVKHSLDTESRPYTWHVELWETEHEQSEGLENFTEAELTAMGDVMKCAAYPMLALVQNCDQVSFDCLCEGEARSVVFTAEDATAFFGRDIKDCYDSPRLFAALVQRLGLSGAVTLQKWSFADRMITIINGTDTPLREMGIAFYDAAGNITSSGGAANADGSPLAYGDRLDYDISDFTGRGITARLSVTTEDGKTFEIDRDIPVNVDQMLTLRGSPETGFTLEP